MKPIRDFLRNHISFSYKEASGFAVILIILLFCFTATYYFKNHTHKEYQSLASDQRKLDSVLALLQREPSRITQLKLFNPNNSTLDDLLEVGFSESLANRIINYRNKGGKFKTKNDLGKIYGLSAQKFQEVYPYIDLPEYLPSVSAPKEYPAKTAVRKEKQINLNTSQAEDLIKIRGIGPVLSERILKFRSALGGFVNANQLYEVYSLDSLLVKELHKITYIDKDFSPAKIDLNLATKEVLSAHPYIKYKKAEAIIRLRKNKPLSSLDEIGASGIFSTEEFTKLKPYLGISVSSKELAE
jgi:competence protein ComEA